MLPRPAVRAHWLLLAAVAFIVLVGNQPLWRSLIDLEPGVEGGLVTLHFLTAIAALFTLVLFPAAHRLLLKPVLIALLLVVALVLWFESEFGIIIDRHIVQSALETDRLEAAELLTPGFLLHLAGYWLLPSLGVAWVRIVDERRLYLPRVAMGIVLAIGVLALTVLSGYKELALLLRKHDELKMMVNPTYPLYAAWQALAPRTEAAPVTRSSLGESTVSRAPGTPSRVLVLVIGETARADHFSLNGYERPTNPRLAERPLVNFGAVAACGTSTAVSLPCIFSHRGRDDFDVDDERGTENLLHLLERAGVDVLWRDNNTGCKGVCDGFEFDNLRHSSDAEFCGDGRCVDEILLQGLEARLSASGRDLLVVLHQAGSHGPSYYRRYPGEFERFTPVCNDDSPQHCSQLELVNAYDNTLLYTDYFLDRLIDLVERSRGDREAAVLYVSDHGESLGERGIYLHGLPYALAPAEQRQVPMLLWLPETGGEGRSEVARCLDKQSGEPLSHDTLFHSILGYFAVATPSHDPSLDLFGRCPPGGAAVGG